MANIKTLGTHEIIKKPCKKFKCYGVVFDLVTAKKLDKHATSPYTQCIYRSKSKHIKIEIELLISKKYSSEYSNDISITLDVNSKYKMYMQKHFNCFKSIFQAVDWTVKEITRGYSNTFLKRIEDDIRSIVQRSLNEEFELKLGEHLKNIPQELANHDNILQKMAYHHMIKDILE